MIIKGCRLFKRTSSHPIGFKSWIPVPIEIRTPVGPIEAIPTFHSITLWLHLFLCNVNKLVHDLIPIAIALLLHDFQTIDALLHWPESTPTMDRMTEEPLERISR